MSTEIELAVVGGTGLYQLGGLERIERRTVETPFGATSGEIVIGDLDGHRLAFLARHGAKHTLAPHRVNYRANIWALHSLGIDRVLGINAVGGISERMEPRAVVLPDQIIDYSHGRIGSFCDAEGARVEHVDFSEPYSAGLRGELSAAAATSGVTLVDGGVYGCTQGPRLETRAEIVRMRRDGCDVVGMTGMPEAVLARELGLSYASLCLVANWAAGCASPGQTAVEITMDEVFDNLASATSQVLPVLRALLTATA